MILAPKTPLQCTTIRKPMHQETNPSLRKNLHRINQPIRLLKNLRIVLHISLTRRRLRPTATLRPNILITRPLTTKRRVKNNLHVFKMTVNIAVIRSTAEMRHRGAPLRRVGRVRRDIGGDLGAREIPDRDGLRCPFCGVDAAADGIEAGAVRSGVVAHVGASGVGFLAWGVTVAVCGVGSGEGACIPDGAAGVGVEGHLVGFLRVDAFDDVDFAALRPGALA